MTTLPTEALEAAITTAMNLEWNGAIPAGVLTVIAAYEAAKPETPDLQVLFAEIADAQKEWDMQAAGVSLPGMSEVYTEAYLNQRLIGHLRTILDIAAKSAKARKQ